MTEQRWSFFKDGDSSFGMFYPKNYILAGFTDRAGADQAARELIGAGIASDDVQAVSGSFLVEELESQADASWLDRVKQSISEFIGTETYFIDQDVALARQHGAFVFAYSPDDEAAQRIEAVIARCQPVYARRYLPMAIERLIEPPQSLPTQPVDTNSNDDSR
jgi:hypothetical protein